MSNSNVREHIIDVIREELIGPSTKLTLGKYEEGYDIPFYESPRSRYGAGILFPQKSFYKDQDDLSSEDGPDDSEDMDSKDVQVSGENPESTEVTEQRPENDYEVTLANEFLPSAMGLSCLIQAQGKIAVSIEGAYYLENKNADKSDGINRVWLRKPFKIELDIEKSELLSDKPQQKIINTGEDASGLKLHIFSRPSPLENASADQRIITFTLINFKETERAKPKDQDCYFQCGFSVSSKDQEKPFLEYPENYFRENLTPEEEEMALLYRHRKIFSVGHGCSTDWSAKDGDEKSEKIETKILPEYEVHPVLPSELNDLNLNMWFLGNEDRKNVLKECSTLAEKYKDWIKDTREDIEKSVPDKFRKPALRHMKRCEDCQERIIKGIKLLSNNDNVWTAFQYMNQAMLMQHCHYSLSTDPEKIRKWISKDALESKYIPPNYESEGEKRKWRPFQLAFILMSLCSIVEEDSPDRDIVDLIWFPTGGGKTEAYLGLAAFTIFYRRITNNKNAGTTAIMRYTLRLLTTQQFQRAASLICAMEKLRRDNLGVFGLHPITIGLWVGSGVTPNQEKYAIQDLNELLRRRGKNKFLLASCPWCGSQMGPVDISTNQTVVKGYLKLRNPDRIRHVCEDLDCEFSDKTKNDGLPLQIVDEHIYSQPPTLVIGTVDKFAMMPWVPNARRLFGLDSNQNYDPPWLIIQDEMHLISGPLGSMVGLYETLIDALCKNKRTGARPKIVASTATISNATDQIEKLFGRKQSVLFPPQGLKSGDSFFAEERSDISGRKYVGVFATGLPSQMTTMVRTLSSLVQAPLTGGFSKEEIDPYWTNMIYFNSVRELGHACTLVRGDIPEYLNVISNIRLNLPHGDERRRYIRQDKELTSRISSDQVTEILNELFKTHHKDENAIDICLATNMIQVGLDVSRLSLMVIAGQPKTTSEYIQASSRVGRGRDYPGLVFTALNPGKPRDRSHYEHFKAYHQSFYKYVEPTSVTPFSVPVRDRALHALIITLVRYWGTDQNRKHPDHPIDDELKNRINSLIAERVKEIDQDELATTLKQVDEIWQRWETLHAPKYGNIFGDRNDDELMLPSSHNQFEDSNRRPFATPTSMRNVDSSCEADIITEYGGV
ncbi:helicase-related protein [Nitrosomonas sp.]|uniref:helicase-related protein n=1 Tax=Nitrosomonas sp. TaxID=42353 RepID=UPI002080DAF2|nr:helicase-related protein [Nitrosomonas sp.]GJL75949.1 MAG: DNA helicase [Nitrosomonas sp.]